MSFSLRVINAPLGSKYWWADYNWGLVSTPGHLDIEETWNCPYGAGGATDLYIIVTDSNYNVIHEKWPLGPIFDNKSYVYDCSTGVLSEEISEPTITEFKIKDFIKV